MPPNYSTVAAQLTEAQSILTEASALRSDEVRAAALAAARSQVKQRLKDALDELNVA